MKVTSIRFQFAMASALLSFALPMNFAMAQGEQIANEATTTLLSDLTDAVNEWDEARIIRGSGLDFTIFQPDGSRVEFANVSRQKNGASGHVLAYDSQGVLTDSFIINRGTGLVDDNRIDFSVQGKLSTITGSITGLANNEAIASISEYGSASKLFRVSYDLTSRDADSLLTMSPMDGSKVLVTSALIIFFVVLFVIVTCISFGWWGC